MHRRSVLVAFATSAALVGGLVVALSQPAQAVPVKSGAVKSGAVRSGAVKSPAVKKPKPCKAGTGANAKQVVVVRSTGSRATVKACRRLATGKYVVSLGPYTGHVGRNGVAKKGAKREGDGKTPWGVYRLRGGFGVYGDPGVAFHWFRTDSRDRWVDDSASRYYNLHKRAPANGRWSSAETLRISPSYDYAQVIGYNEQRTPHRGSAIFFHVDTGKGTAGCVSIKRSALLKILRWEKSGAQISIKHAA